MVVSTNERCSSIEIQTLVDIGARGIWGRKNRRTIKDGDVLIPSFQEMIASGESKTSRADYDDLTVVVNGRHWREASLISCEKRTHP